MPRAHSPAKTHGAIGRFIFEFSGVERELRDCLVAETGLAGKYVSSIITHDFALLCTVVNRVFRQRLDKKEKEELKRLISKCRELNDLRVCVVHGYWVFTPQDGAMLHLVVRQSLRWDYWAEITPHLAAQATAAKQLRGQLAKLLKRERNRRHNVLLRSC